MIDYNKKTTKALYYEYKEYCKKHPQYFDSIFNRSDILDYIKNLESLENVCINIDNNFEYCHIYHVYMTDDITILSISSTDDELAHDNLVQILK